LLNIKSALNIKFLLKIVFLILKRYYVSAVRQLRRLNLASQSPIFSHFGETLTGVTTIRAYDAQNRFVKDMESKTNDNLTFYYPDNLSNR
jgi:ATP-binding cassette subfamily C (CFTR/MRP) protein 1